MREYRIYPSDGRRFDIPFSIWKEVLRPTSFSSEVISDPSGALQRLRLKIADCEAEFSIERHVIWVYVYNCAHLPVKVTNAIVKEIAANVKEFTKQPSIAITRMAESEGDRYANINRPMYYFALTRWADSFVQMGCLMFLVTMIVGAAVVLGMLAGSIRFGFLNLLKFFIFVSSMMILGLGISMRRKWAGVVVCLASLAASVWVVRESFLRRPFPLNLGGILLVILLNIPAVFMIRRWPELTSSADDDDDPFSLQSWTIE
jgi:hypothetical protein